MKRILFYRVNEPYGELSNFAPCPIELKGKVWPTSEHYWADGGDGGGRNRLGQLLMELRAQLR